jgi:hypothetical protein
MTVFKEDPEHEGLYLPLPGTQHYCAPASWFCPAPILKQSKKRNGWVLVRENVTRIPGNSGWTTQNAEDEPEILAYRNQNEHVWYKGKPSGWNVRIETTRREDIEEQEVVAIILMARKA